MLPNWLGRVGCRHGWPGWAASTARTQQWPQRACWRPPCTWCGAAPAARWVWWRGRSGSHGPPQGPAGRTVTPQKQWRCSGAWRRTSALRRHSQWRTKVHGNPWQSLFLVQWSSQGTLMYPNVPYIYCHRININKVSNPWTTVTTIRTRMEKMAACCGSAGPRATACGSARHPQWEGEIRLFFDYFRLFFGGSAAKPCGRGRANQFFDSWSP